MANKRNLPYQNRWVCRKCGRIYTDEQIGIALHPTCYFCGPEYRLYPWMETSFWTFFVFGLIGLSTIGYFITKGLSQIGIASPTLKQIGFFFVPTLLLIFDTMAYVTGRQNQNRMMERGGAQGLLMVAGFALTVVVLLLTGSYISILGIDK